MKRAYNLFAEIISLPFSDLFLDMDPLLRSLNGSEIWETTISYGDRLQKLTKCIAQACLDVAGYLNRHTDVISLTMLQSAFDHIFNARNILRLMGKYQTVSLPGDLMTLYYLDMLKKLGTLFLTGRGGYICVRPDSFSEEVLDDERDKHAPFQIENADNRYQRVELWNSLLRCLPEDLIISAYLADQARNNRGIQTQRSICCQLLFEIGDTARISDLLLDKIMDQGLAETHVHAGASRSFGIIWNDMLKQAAANKKVFEKPSLYLPFKESLSIEKLHFICADAAAVQLILADFLTSNYNDFSEYLKNGPFIVRCNRLMVSEISEIIQSGKPKKHLSSLITPGDCFLRRYPCNGVPELRRILDISEEKNTSCPPLAQKCLLSWSFLHIMERPEDAAFNAFFLYYIRLYCIVYRMRVQDSKSTGLSYFQKYYGASTDSGSLDSDEKLHEFFYTALRDKRVRKTEFRFSPPKITEPTLEKTVAKCEAEIVQGLCAFIKKHVYTLITLYSEDTDRLSLLSREFDNNWRNAIRNIRNGEKNILQCLLNEYSVDSNRIPPHRLGIVYHLIKQGEAREKSSCAVACQNCSCERESYAAFSFGSARFQYHACVTAITNLRNRIPELSSLIVGLDAASLEIPTEPWVFAPAFHEARVRDSVLSQGGCSIEGRRQLGFTYHVGEDFRHPLSGLRHVDEVVSCLEMRTGDRIGHGLVLGLNMKDWFYRNRLVIMPRIEWMENNLWIWDLISCEAELAPLSKYLDEIKRHVFEAARAIYGTLDGITLETLLHTYKAKFFSVEYLKEIVKKELLHSKQQGDCFQMLDSTKRLPCLCDEEHAERYSWTESSLILSYHCGVFKQRMMENILIKPSSSQEEIAQVLQHFLIKKISALGLIIEANPSSNAVIGEMDGVLMHPIYQFRGENGERMMTSVNTDDPSVFSSSIANEYAQIYYTLRYHGESAENALKEIDLIRKIGLETSFLPSPPHIKQLLLEYETVLRVLYAL